MGRREGDRQNHVGEIGSSVFMEVVQEYYLARKKGELKKVHNGTLCWLASALQTRGRGRAEMRDGIEALLQKWVVDGMERLYGVNYPGVSTLE